MPFDRGTDTCIWCLHPMEDDSALKREERVTRCNINELPKHYTKENKTDSRGQILCGHTYRRCGGQTYSQRRSRREVTGLEAEGLRLPAKWEQSFLWNGESK